MHARITTRQPPDPEQAGPITAEASQKSDDLFKRGKDYYKDGKVKEAYGSYRAAWDLKRSYDLAANLGNTELLLGLKRDAAEHYAYCLRTFAATGGKERRDAAQKKFDEARKDVGALVIKVNLGGAEVLVDGKSVGRAPLKDEVYVDPGGRIVEARLVGYDLAKQSVQVEKGAPTQTITLTLVAKQMEVPQGTGIVGKGDGGKGDGGKGVQGPLVPITPPPPPPKKSIPLIVSGAALSAVAIWTGVGLGLTAKAKGNDADALLEKVHASGGPCTNPPQAGRCQDLLSARRAYDAFYNAFVGLVITGTVVGVATVGYAVWPRAKTERPKQRRATSVWVLPVAGPGLGGVGVNGTF